MAFDYKNINQLKDAYNKAKENSGKFDDTPLPEGTYHVKVDKIEIGETGKDSKNPGTPMGKIQFRILQGEHKNKCLFMNQVLFGFKDGEITAFGVKIFDDFIETLKPSFEDFRFSDCNSDDVIAEYKEVMMDVAEDIENLRYDIELTYKDKFSKFKVVKVYE